MNDEIVKEISYVKMSKHRKKTLISLKDSLKLPSDIVKDENMVFSDVSRSLTLLKERNLVECLNDNENQGRLYKITDFGKEVLKYIE
jgi:predicted transcriptional regulator